MLTEKVLSLPISHLYIREAARILQIPDRIINMVIQPYRVIKTNLTIELDSGNVKTFQGYRVQHNHTLGPMKGGIRFHPTVSEVELESLAALMTWKTSLMKLPFGGSKGGIACDPHRLSETELEKLTKSYADKIKEIVGPYLDIPAPDLNTNSQIMAWFMSAYSKSYGFTPAVVTGKPVILHGCEWREEATGSGVVIIIEKFLKDHGTLINRCKFAIQGFGNVGFHVAKFLYELGGTVIAVSNEDGGVYSPNGLKIPQLKGYQDKTGSILGFPDSQQISNEELLTIKCDVLIPAALGNVIDQDIASHLQCTYLVEAANEPTTFEADNILNKRGITIVPDILANAGGVVVSYLEWTQNIQQMHWALLEVRSKLEKQMLEAYERIITVAKEKQCSLRSAAYVLALGRVVKGTLILGL